LVVESLCVLCVDPWVFSRVETAIESVMCHFRVVEGGLQCEFLDAQLQLPAEHRFNAIEAPRGGLTLLLPVSWHIVLDRIGDSTMPLIQWPQQSQPFQPGSIGRERRRRRSSRRMRYAMIFIVSLRLNTNDPFPHQSKLPGVEVACFEGWWSRTFEV
jgi:hypothetical protein